eukprot:CAMPEP_0206168710 /NCGR_PEP_ID=MMETSP1474-20131121/33167_1 /ASSEMBLY_ACC=CAM_ASM_001110 /TAXON_ID=97495 /ORGANISM="Imantonia sp., Strain RCC918" /LENGTH=104 /DNA_ID=CAMNT_0053574271 /DNA_START=75 /DNA_END=389 /DNA_ORIENTATION=-
MLHVRRHEQDQRAALGYDVLGKALALTVSRAGIPLECRKDAKLTAVGIIPPAVEVQDERDYTTCPPPTKRAAIARLAPLQLPARGLVLGIEMSLVVPANGVNHV